MLAGLPFQALPRFLQTARYQLGRKQRHKRRQPPGRSHRKVRRNTIEIRWASTPYFQSNTILHVPDITEDLDPRIISLVVVDIRTRRFAGLKKDYFEDLMHTSGIPVQYFCRRSFEIWDVLLPTKEQAAKLAESCVNTKFFRLQSEYMGTRRIRVTVCNVPANPPGEVVAWVPLAEWRK